MKVYIIENRKLEQSENNFGNGSVNSVSKSFGYGVTQVHSVIIFDKTFGISNIGFIPLTKKPLFVICDGIATINYEKVNKVINEIDWGLEYSGPFVEHILEDAKESGEWTVDFIQNIVSHPVTDEDQILTTSFGYDFIILNGLMVDYQSSDNLNPWAKQLIELNHEMAMGYFDEGTSLHGGDKSKGREYLNLQARFWGETPDSVANPYARKYHTSSGWTDFFILMTVEYRYRITKSQLELRAGNALHMIQDNSNIFECKFLGYKFRFINGLLDTILK